MDTCNVYVEGLIPFESTMFLSVSEGKWYTYLVESQMLVGSNPTLPTTVLI
jgi:hypothetical protein